MTWATKYLGLPFAEGGRGPEAFDCWGLVRQVLLDQHGIDLDAYHGISTNDGPAVAMQVLAEIRRDDWCEVMTPRAFDVAVMWTNRPFSRTLSHIGIVERAGRLLHIEKDKRAICIPLERLAPAFAIHSFYRHKDIA